MIRALGLDKLAMASERATDVAFSVPERETFAAPYRHSLVWVIGLNSVEHAGDLSDGVPKEPASFIKGHHTVTGPGGTIPVPAKSVQTTSEAEIGVAIARR